MRKSTKIVALDQHMDSITVAVAEPGRRPPELYGDIANTTEAITQLARRLSRRSTQLRFCYEAGPCGYGLYRQLTAMGHECGVVAPSLVPRRPGDRIKTDRRDALSLARLHRRGDLAEVWVPDEEQEAIRDLVRCRTGLQARRTASTATLHSFLLRHGRFYSGRSRWTQAPYRWLATQRFAHAAQQVAFEEYVDAVRSASRGVRALEDDLRQALEGGLWSRWSVA